MSRVKIDEVHHIGHGEHGGERYRFRCACPIYKDRAHDPIFIELNSLEYLPSVLGDRDKMRENMERDVLALAQGEYDTWMEQLDKALSHSDSPIEATLKQRGSVHGDYGVQSQMHDDLLSCMMKQPSFLNLKPQHRQALNIIAMKMSRILSGDAEHIDHWHDIAGYATLAEKACVYKDPKQAELDL